MFMLHLILVAYINLFDNQAHTQVIAPTAPNPFQQNKPKKKGKKKSKRKKKKKKSYYFSYSFQSQQRYMSFWQYFGWIQL